MYKKTFFVQSREKISVHPKLFIITVITESKAYIFLDDRKDNNCELILLGLIKSNSLRKQG